MKLKFALILIGASVAAAAPASPVNLSLVMSLVRTVTVNGKVTEQLSPNPKTVLPGNVLSQVVTVSNATTRTVQGVPVTLPVPKNTRYLAPEPGAAAVRPEYSTDQGRTFAPAPLRKTITVMENGRSVQKDVEVKPSEYTTVRWIIPELAAHQTLKLGYRVQIQ